MLDNNRFKDKKNKALCFAFLATQITVIGCKKMVEISAPINSITTSETFSDSTDANSAIIGIYSKLINTQGSLSFADGAISLYAGSSSDELAPFSSNDDQLYSNTLTADNGFTATLWSEGYSYIYRTNSCIEGILASKQLSKSAKDQLTGEAKFLRALFYFYLTNLFGDVPLITSTEWATTSHAARTSQSEIYKQIISDLQAAESLLPADYSISGGERTRANKFAAAAMLSRVYLYIKEWKKAGEEASILINSNDYHLLSDLNSVFLANSEEAILQWQLNTSYSPFNVTPEANNLIPFRNTNPPKYYLSSQILAAFEAGDKRKSAWIDSSTFLGTTYYYPYKYKVGPAQRNPNSTATEYYMVLRLAEQYLIRAEARAELGDVMNAIQDLNALRTRAGLGLLPSSLTQQGVLDAIAQERRIELFSEWGHRWLDLKRTNKVDGIMQIITPLKGGAQWVTTQQLYPIPQSELQRDPSLTQNPGY